MSQSPASDFLDGELDALRGCRGVHTLTDDGREEVLVASRRFAARLAAALDTTLFLADRSVRTLTETPHVRGPASVSDMRDLGIDYMVLQMEEARGMGVPDVKALAPSIPNFDFLTDGLQISDAEVVVTPRGLDHPRLLDRLQGYDDVVDQVRDRIGDRRLVVVDDDGSYRLAK